MATLALEPHPGPYAEAEASEWHDHLTKHESGAASESSSEHSLEIYIDPEKALTPQISRMSQPPLSRKCTTNGTTGTTDLAFEVDWEDDEDPENPMNWSLWRKAATIFTISWGTWVV